MWEKDVNSWYFLLCLYVNRNVSIGQDVCFLKLNDRDKKTEERADFFALTLQMAFASVTAHNVIKCLSSVSLYVTSTIGNGVKFFSRVIYVSLQNQRTTGRHFLCIKMPLKMGNAVQNWHYQQCKVK